MGAMKVLIGQKWRHLPSGDERFVQDIVPWEVAAGAPPGEYERQHGFTHVARMVQRRDGLVGRDRRDSSDMVLREGAPAHPTSWELVADAEP